jgi:hypothetical protein
VLDSLNAFCHHDAKMRTTISINDVTLRELREQAVSSGTSFREVVERSLDLGLAQLAKPRSRGKFRVRPHSLGLKAGFQGVSLNQLYDQIETEEGIRRT